MIFLKSQT